MPNNITIYDFNRFVSLMWLFLASFFPELRSKEIILNTGPLDYSPTTGHESSKIHAIVFTNTTLKCLVDSQFELTCSVFKAPRGSYSRVADPQSWIGV